MIGVTPTADDSEIPAARLDDILSSFGTIAVVKVDAEDLSIDALESGMTVLQRDRPLVAVEAASDAEQGRLRRLLLPLGYELVGQYCWTPTWLWEPAN